MGLAIVAIPEETDRVWKVSSEKIPHLTLLFLGDEESADTQSIVQFVQHAVELSEHGQFYLDVDRRGELGEANADVLFFSNRSWNLKWIKQFRGQLLQNGSIRSAYDSAEQFTAPQDWVPHLTLGYPESPAKELPPENDYPLYSVAFDRIAVWTGDFDGPEFRLEWPDRDQFDGPLGVAWADTQKAAIQHYGTLEAAIEHYGTKGMKWGVRKEKVAGAARSAGSAVKSGAKAVGRGAKRAVEAADNHFYTQSIYSTARHEAIHNQVARDITPKVFKLASAPKYRGRSLKENKALKEEYDQDVAKVTNSAYRQAVSKHIGSNAKGDKKAIYVDDARGQRIEIREVATRRKVAETPLKSRSDIAKERADQFLNELLTPKGARHAATEEPETEAPDITIPVKVDENGLIKEVGLVKTEDSEPLEQTALKGADFVGFLVHGIPEDGEAFILEHYGVKGMHWGSRKADDAGGGARGAQRKTPPEAVTPTAKSKVPAGARRKTKIETEGGQNHPAHEDAIKVAEAKAKLKKSGPAALSNKELQEVQTRLNLERNVSGLVSNNNRIARGRQFVRGLTGNVQEVNNTVNTGLQSARLAEQLKNR